MENPLLLEEEEEYSQIARLIELGRQKTYVTIDDILHFFPEAEQDVNGDRTDGIVPIHAGPQGNQEDDQEQEAVKNRTGCVTAARLFDRGLGG